MQRSTHNLGLPAFVAACFALGGCATPVQSEAWAELGTGEWRFEPLVDEQLVTLVAGSQGGFHVWASVRATGLDRDDVTFEIETEPVDGSWPAEVSSIVVDLESDDDDPTMDRFVGWPAVLSRPGCMSENAMYVRVRLTDRDGVTAEDSRTVVPRPDSAAPPAACGGGRIVQRRRGADA